MAENKQRLLLSKEPLGEPGGNGGDGDDNKAWYYWQDKDGKGYILAFVNGRVACRMRRFDAKNGRFLSQAPNPKGNYQDNFAKYIHPERQLYLSQQPNLVQACKEKGLPDWAASELKPPIQAILGADQDG